MNKKFKYIVFCLFMSLCSCNDWLDVELVNKIDEDKLFDKKEGFYEALAGIYGTMSGSSLYGRTLTMEYMDIYGGYYSSGNSKYTEYFAYNYENAGVASTHASIWRNMYKCIAACNNILEWSDKNAGVLGETDRNQVRGEAMALRAFLHFDLYRMFCSDFKSEPKAEAIPYNKKFGVSLPYIYTNEEYLQLVLNDLLEAETLLVNDPIVSVVPYELGYSEENELISKDAADKYVARMNLYAVKALKARVYQARGQNEKAIECAKEVIESSKFRLLEFESVDKDDNLVDMLFSDEHIFSLRNKDLQDYSKAMHYDEVTETSTTFKSLPFSNIFATYESNNDDVRYVKWVGTGDFMKFVVENTDKFARKMPVIKLSEMYLLIAECSFAQNPEQSLEYINTLRNHRIRNNRNWNSITQDYIIQEMKREYLCEGQMFYVYKRNNMEIPGVSVDEGINIFVFPMPQDEIEDGNRTQNN